MSDLGRVLRLDAHRTALFLAVPILAVLGVVAAWRALIPGVAYWDNAVTALTASVRLLGPVAAALAAWVAMREHRLDYLRGLTARSPAIGPLIDMLLLTAVALTAYGVVTVVMLVSTLMRDEAGELRPTGIVAGAVTLALYVVAGYLVGPLVSHLVVIPLVAVLGYMWAALRPDDDTVSWWALLPPASVGHLSPFTNLRPGLFTDQTLWSLGLATAMILGYVWALTRRGALVVPIVAALALTVVGTVRLHGYQGTAVASSPVRYACRQWPLTICVHPALRAALPTLEVALTPLATRLGGTPGELARVEQRPSGDSAQAPAGVAFIHLDDLSPGYEHRAAREIMSSLMDVRVCGEPKRVSSVGYSALVTAWLLDEELPHVADTRAARVYAGWDEQERRAWLRAHYPRFRWCGLSGQDFR